MKTAAKLLFGVSLLAIALPPAAAWAQQQVYAPPEHHEDRDDGRAYGEAPAYGRYGQGYTGRVDTPAYDERRYEQRSLDDAGRRYGDGQAYSSDRSYGRRDGVDAGYGARYRGERYRSYAYRGDAYRDRVYRDGGYAYRRYGDGYAYGGAYPDYAYDPALGYEGVPYDNNGYDEYSGFVAPPVYGEDYGPTYYGRSYGRCGCGY